MEVKPIVTEEEYNAALARLDAIFNAKKGTAESEELELLAEEIERYEDRNYSFDD